MRNHSARILAGVVVSGALVFAGSPAFAQYGHVPVTVCHKPGSPAEKSLTVDESAVPGHLGQGDYLGECTPAPEPTPEPTPTPEPEPTPEPTEEPTPEPTEEPVIEPAPEPIVEPPEEPKTETPTSPVEPAESVPATVEPVAAAEAHTPPVILAETGAEHVSPWAIWAALARMGGGILALFRKRRTTEGK